LEFQTRKGDITMSECCGKRELTREEISEIFGVEWVTRDYGVYRVKPRIREPEILEYRVHETTPEYRELLNEMKRTAYVRVKFGGLLRRLLYKQCYKEEPPRILFRLSPLYFESVKFHWGGLWFEGEIATKFENNSEEGKEGVAWVRRRQTCPENPEEYEWNEVEGSASLLGNWLNGFWEDTQNIFISKLTQKTERKVDINDYISVTGHWKTDPFSMDTFMTLWNIFTTGTIVTRHGFDATVIYNFNGQHVRTFRVDLRVRLPIKGDVGWLNL